MDNKGFTLIELLASIVILAIIMALAIPSISSVSNAIRTNQRKNLINKIEIAASKYAFDTHETIVFVETLVKEGYIESDNDNDEVIDPVTNKKMNCYIITMQKKSDYYIAEFHEDIKYDSNGICNINKLEEANSSIDISVNGSKISEWYSGEVTLEAKEVDCVNNKCVWISNKGLNATGATISINPTAALKSKYTFIYTRVDLETKEIMEETKSIELKIDNEPPAIYKNLLEITDSKTISIAASDGQGSGYLMFHMKKNDDNLSSEDYCKSIIDSSQYQTSNEFEIKENGNYAICAKDKVGNTSGINIDIN